METTPAFTMGRLFDLDLTSGYWSSRRDIALWVSYLSKMFHTDISAVARFGTGIHSLKAGIPNLVKNLQVHFPLPLRMSPTVAELSPSRLSWQSG